LRSGARRTTSDNTGVSANLHSTCHRPAHDTPSTTHGARIVNSPTCAGGCRSGGAASRAWMVAGNPVSEHSCAGYGAPQGDRARPTTSGWSTTPSSRRRVRRQKVRPPSSRTDQVLRCVRSRRCAKQLRGLVKGCCCRLAQDGPRRECASTTRKLSPFSPCSSRIHRQSAPLICGEAKGRASGTSPRCKAPRRRPGGRSTGVRDRRCRPVGPPSGGRPRSRNG
jgi:hypothetical protein